MERIVGLSFKIRSKTIWGYGALEKALARPYLSCYLRGREGVWNLRKVI
jgi:hypothetical protein